MVCVQNHEDEREKVSNFERGLVGGGRKEKNPSTKLPFP